jgi:hypothetical protein
VCEHERRDELTSVSVFPSRLTSPSNSLTLTSIRDLSPASSSHFFRRLRTSGSLASSSANAPSSSYSSSPSVSAILERRDDAASSAVYALPSSELVESRCGAKLPDAERERFSLPPSPVSPPRRLGVRA